MAEFSNLIPGMLYNCTVKTEKEGFKDSLPVRMQIETGKRWILKHYCMKKMFQILELCIELTPVPQL